MKISNSQYARLLLEITRDDTADFNKELTNFIKLLRRNRKLGNWRQIVSIFTDLYNQEHGILPLKIITVDELTDTQQQKIITTLSTKLNKEIEATFQTDPKLVGGLKVIGPDFLIDNSIYQHLHKLRANL